MQTMNQNNICSDRLTRWRFGQDVYGTAAGRIRANAVEGRALHRIGGWTGAAGRGGGRQGVGKTLKAILRFAHFQELQQGSHAIGNWGEKWGLITNIEII